MKRDIARLTALALILIATFSTASAKRLLLSPPDGYKGVEINGIKYVVGQVYLPLFTDTTELKQYGFRGFEAIGSTSAYKKVKAIWPLDTELSTLPELIIGLTYEKAKNVEEMQKAYATTDPLKVESIGQMYTVYGDQISNYGGFVYVAPRYTPAGDPNYRLDNYGLIGIGSSGGSRSVCPPNGYYDYGHRYRTHSATNLHPTRIGSMRPSRFSYPRYYR